MLALAFTSLGAVEPPSPPPFPPPMPPLPTCDCDIYRNGAYDEMQFMCYLTATYIPNHPTVCYPTRPGFPGTNQGGGHYDFFCDHTQMLCEAEMPYYFNRLATHPICSYLSNCTTDEETVAEIVVASPDGMYLLYSNSERGTYGLVDIANPASPQTISEWELGGEPTSLAVSGQYVFVAVNTSPDYTNPSGKLFVAPMTGMSATFAPVVEFDMFGQPDAVSVSPDGQYIAIAIENERDEDLGDGELPQMPAGHLMVVDAPTGMLPGNWVATKIEMTGLNFDVSPEDPEPEYVSINSDNIAVVTFQENNGIALVDLATKQVTKSFSAGSVHLSQVDTIEEDIIKQDSSLSAVPREPDGVVWIDNQHFATADEGDMNGGSRGFTIFNTDGHVVYTSGNTMEHLVASIGHYPEARSENKGNEPENVFYGVFGDEKLLFVNSERASVVAVYEVSNPAMPKFKQVLPAGLGPEGGVAIPQRDLIVVASEKDSRDDKVRSSLSIYKRSAMRTPQYPTIISNNRDDGTPIPFGALSGLTNSPTPGILYSVEDSFYKASRIFKLDVRRHPARLTSEIRIYDKEDLLANAALIPAIDLNTGQPIFDANGTLQYVFDAEERAALINSDKSVNLDLEGICIAKYLGEDHFVIASEGRGTYGSSSRPIEYPNFLLVVNMEGVIKSLINTPSWMKYTQLRFGVEGIAPSADGNRVVAILQRNWPLLLSAPYTGIASWPMPPWSNTDEVITYGYPLDDPTSPDGGWVGLSDITLIEGTKYYILERDNKGGPDATIKKVYMIDLTDYTVVTGMTGDGTDLKVLNKVFVKDLIPELKKLNGATYEKVEGMALAGEGQLWFVNDNDGVDDNSGEIQLMKVNI